MVVARFGKATEMLCPGEPSRAPARLSHGGKTGEDRRTGRRGPAPAFLGRRQGMRRWSGNALVILVLTLALAWGGTPGSAPAAEGPEWSFGPKVELAPGVAYQELEGRKPNGNGGQALPLRAHVLWVDAGDKDARIKVVPGGDNLGDRAVLSRLAERHGALAAVNGGYFCLQAGQPDGNLVLDGRLVATVPESRRISLGVFGRTGIGFGNFQPKVWLEVRGETYAVQRFNRPPHPDGLTVYTSDWGPEVPAFNGMAVSVRRDADGETVTGRSALVVPIPEDGYVVVFTGRSAGQAHEFVPGTRVRLQVDLGADNLTYLLEGGPLLVENGRPVPGRAMEEGFTGSILNPNPRTAVGVTATSCWWWWTGGSRTGAWAWILTSWPC